MTVPKEDIRDGLKRALLLNEKVEALDKAVNGLAQDPGSLVTHVHELDKRLENLPINFAGNTLFTTIWTATDS